ncbi:ras-domain-containing protein, partial [Ceratobasidium sp. AG-I]
QTYDPTIEDAYRRSVIIDDKMTYVEIIDTAGPEEYATLCEQWIREGEGYILVYSIASRFSYERMRSFQAAIVRVKGETRPTYMLVGNQSDREGERQVSRVEAQALSEEWDCPWMEVSAKTGRDVDRMFSDTIRALRANRDRDTRAKPSQPSVSSKSVKKPAIKTILFSNFFGTSREKDKEKGQEHEPDRELNRPVDDGDRMLWDISRLIGSCSRRVPFCYSYVLNLCRLLYQRRSGRLGRCRGGL